jgi:hypothetical protein
MLQRTMQCSERFSRGSIYNQSFSFLFYFITILSVSSHSVLSDASEKYNKDFTEMSFISFDQFALHIGWKTREAKKRQREGQERSVLTKAALSRGENPVKKAKASRNSAVKRREYIESLPFAAAAVVRNAELKQEIEANGPPQVFFSNTRTKAIALDVGVRNLCGWSIEYVDSNVSIQQLPPYDYTPNQPNQHIPIQNCRDVPFVQKSGTISTKTVYQQTGVQSRNHIRERLVKDFQMYSDAFLDECEELQSNSTKSVTYEKLVLAAQSHNNCFLNEHGRLYSTTTASKTKYLNRVRMKQYFTKLFQSFIGRLDPNDNKIRQDPNYVFIGGSDTFGKGLSKRMITAFQLMNKANAILNNIDRIESNKRFQFHNENEFRTSIICP